MKLDVYDRGRGNNLPEALGKRSVTAIVTMTEKCPKCGEEIKVFEDGSYLCNNCGDAGKFE
jgi:tRNA(Ile2) C34 agmatinyltransferase TiaS